MLKKRNKKLTINQKKYVITGGPGSGKSTLIQILQQKNYKVIHEVARNLIEEQLLRGGKLLPWIDRDRFQREVLKYQLLCEKNIKDNIIFIDRGIPDGLAYYRLEGLIPPSNLISTSKKITYTGVFLLDLLPNYKKDSVRYHHRAESIKIHNLLLDVYTELGYDVKKVPVLPVEERVDWVLNHI